MKKVFLDTNVLIDYLVFKYVPVKYLLDTNICILDFD